MCVSEREREREREGEEWETIAEQTADRLTSANWINKWRDLISQ